MPASTSTRLTAVLALSLATAWMSATALGVRAQGRAAGATRPTVTSPRLYVFDGGVLESDPGRYELTAKDVGTTQLSIGAYLIVHPRGVLLWDAGAVTDTDWTPTGKPSLQRLTLSDGQAREVTLERTLQSQLAASGFKPSDVTYLALSHYHWDHTANANAFAGATWLARKEDRDAMFGAPQGTSRPATYSALRTAKTTVITGAEHDVFGDGTVVLKRAFGHTPGHQVLFLKLARTGNVLLSGDLYHYRAERAMGKLPTFEFNKAQTTAARTDIEAFMTKTKAQLWIQHELDAHRKLKKAPEFYE